METSATITIATRAFRAVARTMGSSAMATTTVIARSDTTTTVIEALTTEVGAAVLAMNKRDEQAKACRNFHLKVNLPPSTLTR